MINHCVCTTDEALGYNTNMNLQKYPLLIKLS